MSIEKITIEESTTICWYQTHYERYVTGESYPLPECKTCLPDKSNENCSCYIYLGNSIKTKEEAIKFIEKIRKEYKK